MSAARERLVLPRALRDEIVAHAREEQPRECCGFVAGRNGVARRVLRCTNESATPEVRYTIKETRWVFDIEDAGEELLAIYHSHPRSPAYPSPIDRREAHYPEAFHVLVSLRDATRDPEMFAYRIVDHDAVVEAELAE